MLMVLKVLSHLVLLLSLLIVISSATIVVSFVIKPIASLRTASSRGKVYSTYQSLWWRGHNAAAYSLARSTRTTSTSNQLRFQSTLQMSSRKEKRVESDIDSVLWKWATHTDASYHDFSPEEATAIRSALLTWYRGNRRKLPWRGDAGPYDGSTAGIATSSSKRTAKKKIKGQKDIKSFFGKKVEDATTATDEANDKEMGPSDPKSEAAVIPVTGYSVWVSEIMLQQTRVEAVIKYYLKWMESFPTVQDLANATEEEVNSHWAGLGFYRRARLLHKGAKFVVDELDGVVPNTVDDLLAVSGIGRYTASAVASIAYDKCVPVVDGNVCRVISRLKGVANNIKAPIFKDKVGWRLAEQIVTAGDGLHAGEVNQALMELGATYCAPSGSGVDTNDPLIEFYMSTTIGQETNMIVKKTDALAISGFVSKASIARCDSKCSLCEEGGISSVLFQLGEDLALAQEEPGQPKDAAAIIGHSKFPTAPPKKAKREEVLGVTALFHNLDSAGDEKWFMIKRPADGLLGKSICVF